VSDESKAAFIALWWGFLAPWKASWEKTKVKSKEQRMTIGEQ
jgi:hypothetical protein